MKFLYLYIKAVSIERSAWCTMLDYILVQSEESVLWVEHLGFFLGFLVTAVKSHGKKKKKKVTASVFIVQINPHTLTLLLSHCVIAVFCCFSKGASNDGGLCVRWICSVTLLVMLMFITSLMWNFEVPQMVLCVIIQARCSGFVTCK